MKQKKMRITEADYLLANRRASRQEEIQAHGHPVQSRCMVHKSKKVYDRKRMKRANFRNYDDGSFSFYPDRIKLHLCPCNKALFKHPRFYAFGIGALIYALILFFVLFTFI